jgi:hypothetical protein
VRTLQHLGHLSAAIQNLRLKGALHHRIMTLMGLSRHPCRAKQDGGPALPLSRPLP